MPEKKKSYPTQPSFVGKNVFLRTETSEDAMNAHVWFVQSEPQAQASMPLPFLTLKDVAELFEKRERSTDRARFTIVRKEDKRPVGRITFFNCNSLNRSAELGILIDPDERRQGHAAEALRILINYLFRFRNLNKVYAETAEFNSAAVALLESLGFKKDGTLRNHYYYDGEYHDKFVYSLLRFEVDW